MDEHGFFLSVYVQSVSEYISLSPSPFPLRLFSRYNRLDILLIAEFAKFKHSEEIR